MPGERLAHLAYLIGLGLAAFLGLEVEEDRNPRFREDVVVSFDSLVPAGGLQEVNHVREPVDVVLGGIERQIAAGHFPKPRRIGRSVRILASDLQAYAQNLPTHDLDWRGLPGDPPPTDAPAS